MRGIGKIVGMLALFGAVSAIAAPDAPAAGQPTSANGPAPVMSVADMNVSTASLEAQIDSHATEIIRLQEVAKRQKDVIKLNCVNDRLVQFKAQRNIADETHNQLTAAIQKNSEDRQGLYGQFVSESEAIKDLYEQAKACIGTPDFYKQESGVTVDHPPITDDPGIINPTLEPIEPPQYASPFD